MAVGTTTALVIAGVSLIGSGLAAYGTIQAGQTQKKIGEYNAKVAENQAIEAEMVSRENLKRERTQASRFLAKQRTAIAGAGVTEAGSPLEVMAASAAGLELQALDNMRLGRMQATALRAQGAMARYEGKQAARASLISAGATMMQGAAQSASIYGSLAPAKAPAAPAASAAPQTIHV